MESKKIIPLDEIDEREKSRFFKDELLKFNNLHGRENFKVPQIGGKELDLFKLYKEVINRGGSQLVSENKQWKEIVNVLELPASCTSASFTLRNHYNRCLQSYESYFFKGQNPPITSSTNLNNMNSSNISTAPIANIVPSGLAPNNINHTTLNTSININAVNPIALHPTINTSGANISNAYNMSNANFNISNQPSSKKEETMLGKKVIRNDAEFNLIFRYQGKSQLPARDKSYQKKVRLLNAVPDMRKIVLAFESHVTSEIIWALNILLLFSSNNSCSLQLEYQPYLIESMTNYLYYCVNNISEFFFLIDILEGNFGKFKTENPNLFTGIFNSSNLPDKTFSSNTMNFNNMNNNLTTNTMKNEILNLNFYYSLNNYNPSFNNMSSNQTNSLNFNNPNNFTNNNFGLINQKDASTRLQNKRAKSFNESTTFHFMEEINNTISLSTISKKNKNLLEIEKKKNENQINLNFEEVSEFELIEHLITIIQIVRNLSLLKVNETPILKCQKFMNMLYLIFIWTNIHDLKIICLDIITNLAKHIALKDIKYPLEFLNTIFEFLKNPNREISEQALECLRKLTFPSGNDEFFEKMPDEFFEELINLLMSYKIEIREAAIEILYFLSDQKLPTKTRLGKQNKCIQRLVAIVSSNSTDSKISKWAVCTLAKLAEVPSILKIINCYEQELFFAACTDESISRVIMGILSNS